MENPIPKSNLFYTPENLQELMDYIEDFSGSDKALAYTIAMMTMNACSQMVDNMMEETNEI